VETWRGHSDPQKRLQPTKNLSKAFDILPHELIVLKLKEYGADEATTTLIKDYLSNRFQSQTGGHTFELAIYI